MTKHPNDNEFEKKPSTGEKNVRPIDDQGLNDELQSVISDYWKDRQAPEFTGYKTNKEKGCEEEVHSKSANSNKPKHKSRHLKNFHQKKEKKSKRKSKAEPVLKTILVVLVVLIVVSGATFAFLRYQGQKSTLSSRDSDEKITMADDAVSENGGKTVTYKGQLYTYNDRVSSILFIGVDRDNYNADEKFGEAGQSDTIILIAVNHDTGATTMIPISRNTMVGVDQYNTDGTYWKQDTVQLAMAFGYGDGKQTSCENVAKSVSRLLYGMPVNQYACMDLSCISKLNDAVGGVEVQVLEDLTFKDPALVKDQNVTLMGDQAEIYVRTRNTVITDDSQDNNAARMERQKQYLMAFIQKALTKMKKNPTLPVSLYSSLGDDAYTDLSTSDMVYYGSLILSKGFNNTIVSIPGEVKHGEYTEVYPDEDALYQIVLDTFYVRE